MGYQALYANSSGSYNTALGYQAGYTNNGSYANTTGSNNTFIGYNSGPFSSTQRNNMTAIGVFALVDQANSLVLGGTAFYAVNVGIGTATPSAVLDIQGGDRGGNAALIVNQTGAAANDIFTASASGATKFRIANGGNLISVAGANWQPITDSTTALNIANAAGTSFVDFDTTNSRVGIGTTGPTALLHVNGGNTGGNAALIVNQTGTSGNDIFTASASGVTTFILTNGGNASASAGFTINSAGSLQTTNNNTLTIGGDTSGELILKQSNLNLLRAPGGAGTGNLFLGLQAGSNGAGASNTAVGYQALPNFTSGGSNTAVGYQALYSNTSRSFLTAVGYKALTANSSGQFNTAMGYIALTANTTGASNTAMGYTALASNTTGGTNTAVGSQALNANTTGSSNTALGFNALVSNTTGTANTALGYQALFSNSSGQFNTALGYQAGYTSVAGNANAIGTNNTFLGYNSGPGSTNWLTNAAAIGSYATVTCPNCLVLGSIEGINTATASASVGIGIASPIAVLDVRGGNTGGNAALIVNQTGASANDIFTASASGTSVFKITNAGNVRTVGALCVKATMSTACAGSTAGTIYATNTTVQAADVAENYIASQQLEPGDVVVPANDGNNMAVVKAGTAFQGDTIGVVSTNPGVTLNSDAATDSTHPYLYPIALAGRIPVKVSTESGAILVGDHLTPSGTKPGYAMKTTRAGKTVGIALEAASVDGKILALLNLSWYDPSVYITSSGSLASTTSMSTEAAALALGLTGIPDTNQQINQSTNQQITNSTNSASFDLAGDQNFIDLKSRVASAEARIEDLRNAIVNSSTQSAFLASISSEPQVLGASTSADFISNLQNLDIASATISGNLMVLGRTTLADLGVTGNIAAGLLSVHGLDPSANNGDGGATINSVGDLSLQNNGLGGINILAGKVTIDTKGNINSQGEITVKKINIDTTPLSGTSLGSGTLLAGESSVTISTTAVTGRSRILVTPTTKTGNQVLVVSNKSSGSGFTISIEQPYNRDIKFDWWIVDEK